MKGDKKHILICGNYGAGNLGDEAILDGLICLVRSSWSSAAIKIMSSNPTITCREHKIEAVNLFPAGPRSMIRFLFTGQFIRTIGALGKADLVILGGGGLFSDEKPKAILIWFIQYCWFRLLRKKMVCLSQSVGPLRYKWSRKLTATVFRYAKLVTVRDRASARLLKAIGIKDSETFTDAAFAMGYINEKSRHLQPQIVLSLRSWPNLDAAKVSEIARLINWLDTSHGFKTVFIPFQQAIADDREVYQRILKLVSRPDVFQLKEVADYHEALEIIGRSRLVVGMRLHSVIFSMLESKPFLALSYSEKVKDFAADAGLGELVIDLQDKGKMSLKERVQHLMEEDARIIRQLDNLKLKNTYRFFEQEKALKQLL